MPRFRPETIVANLNKVLADPSLGIVYRQGRWQLNALGRLRAEYLAQETFQTKMRDLLYDAMEEDGFHELLRRDLEWEAHLRAQKLYHRHRRRAREARIAVRDLTPEQWEQIKKAWGNRCAYCGDHCHALALEHMHPISRGGNHTASNVVPACKSCNSRKGYHRMLPFACAPDPTLLPAPLIIPPDEVFMGYSIAVSAPETHSGEGMA